MACKRRELSTRIANHNARRLSLVNLTLLCGEGCELNKSQPLFHIPVVGDLET